MPKLVNLDLIQKKNALLLIFGLKKFACIGICASSRKPPMQKTCNIAGNLFDQWGTEY